MTPSLERDDLIAILHAFRQSRFGRIRFELGPLRIAVDRTLPGRASARAPMAGANGPVPGDETGLTTVASPSLGWFVGRSGPEAPPFVEPGRDIRPDTTVGAIDVLGRRTEVKAGVCGSVVEVAVEEGSFVEFGQPLFRVREKDTADAASTPA